LGKIDFYRRKRKIQIEKQSFKEMTEPVGPDARSVGLSVQLKAGLPDGIFSNQKYQFG
jgi:hypothetical protein